jgi:hypothetical protein
MVPWSSDSIDWIELITDVWPTYTRGILVHFLAIKSGCNLCKMQDARHRRQEAGGRTQEAGPAVLRDLRPLNSASTWSIVQPVRKRNARFGAALDLWLTTWRLDG